MTNRIPSGSKPSAVSLAAASGRIADRAETVPGVIAKAASNHLGPLAEMVRARSQQKLDNHALRQELKRPDADPARVRTMLQERHADVDALSRRHRNTAVLALFSGGHQEQPKFDALLGALESKGPLNLQAVNSDGDGIVHASVKSQSLPAARFAARYADPRIENHLGESALALAKTCLDQVTPSLRSFSLSGSRPARVAFEDLPRRIQVAQQIYKLMGRTAALLDLRDAVAEETRRINDSREKIDKAEAKIQLLEWKLGFSRSSNLPIDSQVQPAVAPGRAAPARTRSVSFLMPENRREESSTGN